MSKPRHRVTHELSDSGIIERAKRFQKLTVKERLDLLREFTDFALTLNPDLLSRKRASQLPGPSEVLSSPKS